MNKHYAAAATLVALAGWSAGAHAQDETDAALDLATGRAPGGSSVMLYGVIDANIEYLSHASATGGSLVRENSGGIHNSRFGVRGTESLGGGTSAWFVLEAGFNSNDGTQATAGTLFNRTAAVGLANDRLGSLSFGLQYTAMYDILLRYDPMTFAQQYTWFPTTGSADSFAFRARNNNSVKYVGRFRGLTAIAEYSFGGDAASFQSSAAYGGGLDYDGGTFGAAVAYDYRNGAINSSGTWTKSRNVSVTVRQDVGRGELLAGYEHYLYNPTRSAAEAQQLWFGGVRYPVLKNLKVTAAYYYEQNKTADTSNAWMSVLSAQYALSKRTSLYATVAYAQATRYANGQFTPVGTTDDTAFGSNQTGVTIGMFHKF
ncbi:porin [Paraburkholderia caballeronis]|uniref:Outer membrane protein (Porin) n=1 Tax=Paraburkholderia caballeronis TaxID=416943 RepID=A0A1H7TUK5_9BURK|nr:porin [Paraburkholderia caballeronis]PXW17667.1 putative porin [Paraburkholderia caballeronis]PXW95412.1 putative porin [Paraburkholderia caballeronis]RAJ91226.1 putative porin [Paraburkholderia caballeronis]SEE12015.1 Outer membrane protein (porin) [Paraburkholderia caballeronis]SEL88421.1 Outer membrane protein (porin) [Paraburkholderia caballeronis]